MIAVCFQGSMKDYRMPLFSLFDIMQEKKVVKQGATTILVDGRHHSQATDMLGRGGENRWDRGKSSESPVAL